jgi:hypothetical protein
MALSEGRRAMTRAPPALTLATLPPATQLLSDKGNDIVGIAGEDDLDATELLGPLGEAALSAPKPHAACIPPGQSAGLDTAEALQSASEQLLTELATLLSTEDLTLWALRRLPAKNTPQEDDAEAVNAAYRSKLDKIQLATHGAEGISQGPILNSGGPQPGEAIRAAEAVVPRPKTVRQRNKAHLAFVASQPYLVCKQTPCDAHHLKFAQPRGLGRKVSDEYTVPLCRKHHTNFTDKATNERGGPISA